MCYESQEDKIKRVSSLYITRKKVLEDSYVQKSDEKIFIYMCSILSNGIN